MDKAPSAGTPPNFTFQTYSHHIPHYQRQNVVVRDADLLDGHAPVERDEGQWSESSLRCEGRRSPYLAYTAVRCINEFEESCFVAGGDGADVRGGSVPNA
jgi:hypothetical protein